MDTTLRKGLRLLEVLSENRAPRGAAELGRELGMTRSNVFRLLTTLAELGYVRRADDAGRYAATLKVWELGTRVAARDPLRRVAQPYLRALHAETGGNVFLSMLDGRDVLYLDKVESETATHVSAQPGMRLPALRIASGRILLAQGEIDALLAVPPDEEAIDPAELRRDLILSRERGWATTRDGSRPGVVSIAAPVFAAGSAPVAAIAVSRPLPPRDADARHDAVLTALLNTCARLSGALGHSG